MIALDLRRSGRPSWGRLIVSAVVDWLLATMILLLNPVASIFAVGLIVGIDLVVGGAALVGVGLSLRASANDAEWETIRWVVRVRLRQINSAD